MADIIVEKMMVEKTAHIYCSNKYSLKDRILLALHGYGQSAEHFFISFRGLSENIGIIAPEGLSKFYWKGFQGDVVASWMTKLNRLSEINDYNSYLTSVYDKYEFDKKKVVYLGFSQGATTLLRWIETSRLDNIEIILVGNLVPQESRSFLMKQKIKLHLIFGDNDVFISKEKIRDHINELNQTNIDFTLKVVEGKHEINANIVREINTLMNAVSSHF